MALCLSKRLNGSSWFLTISYIVWEGNSGIHKNKGTFLWNFVSNYKRRRFFCFFFRHGTSIIASVISVC